MLDMSVKTAGATTIIMEQRNSNQDISYVTQCPVQGSILVRKLSYHSGAKICTIST